MSEVTGVVGAIFIFALIVVGGMLIYHFLIFPNIDGVAQDTSFYNYDNDSQHYLYWFGFWMIWIFGSIAGYAKLGYNK